MLSPNAILSWLEDNVKGMRRSRAKTLAEIAPAAMALFGVGVLALGRAMQTRTTCKHNIKRVNRFLGNTSLEAEALAQGIFEAFAPRTGRVLVLADWTDVPNGKLLVFSLPANGHISAGESHRFRESAATCFGAARPLISGAAAYPSGMALPMVG